MTRDPGHLRCTFEPVRPARMDGFVVHACNRCGRTVVRAGTMPPAVQPRLDGLETAGAESALQRRVDAKRKRR